MPGKTLLSIGLLICCGAGSAALNSETLSAEHTRVHSASDVTADTAQVKLTISGMTCGSCATTARIALERVDGVHEAEVSYDSASAVVSYDPGATSPEEFTAYLKEMTGYEARVVEPAQKPKENP